MLQKEKIQKELEITDIQFSDKYPMIVFKTGNELKIVNIDDIYYCEADGPYTRVYLETEVFMVTKSLKQFNVLLDFPYFKRVSRSYVINVLKINKISLNSKSNKKNICLTNLRTIELSSRLNLQNLVNFIKHNYFFIQ